jgi:hypothetical protein
MREKAAISDWHTKQRVAAERLDSTQSVPQSEVSAFSLLLW